MKGLSIIVPTYNEAQNIQPLLRKLVNVKKQIKAPCEIIVVDDNSPDATAQVAMRVARRCKGIRILVRENERGLASAILYGVQRSKYDAICVMDADFQHPPELIPKLWKNIKEADIVVASRFMPGSKVDGLNFHRKMISKLAILVPRVLFSKIRRVKDPVSGFFMFKKELMNGISFNPYGFKFLLELIVKSKWKKIVEYPFTFKKRRGGTSKLNLKEFLNYLKLLLDLCSIRPFMFGKRKEISEEDLNKEPQVT